MPKTQAPGRIQNNHNPYPNQTGVEVLAYMNIRLPIDCRTISQYARTNNLPLYITGTQSHTLFGNQKHRIALAQVTHSAPEIIQSQEQAVLVAVGAGMKMSELASWTAHKGLHGLETFANSAGSIGGCYTRNTKAHGVVLRNLVHSIDSYHPEKDVFASTAPAGYITESIIYRVVLKLTRNSGIVLPTGPAYQYLATISPEDITPQHIHQAIIDAHPASPTDIFFFDVFKDVAMPTDTLHKHPKISALPHRMSRGKAMFASADVLSIIPKHVRRHEDCSLASYDGRIALISRSQNPTHALALLAQVQAYASKTYAIDLAYNIDILGSDNPTKKTILVLGGHGTDTFQDWYRLWKTQSQKPLPHIQRVRHGEILPEDTRHITGIVLLPIHPTESTSISHWHTYVASVLARISQEAFVVYASAIWNPVTKNCPQQTYLVDTDPDADILVSHTKTTKTKSHVVIDGTSVQAPLFTPELRLLCGVLYAVLGLCDQSLVSFSLHMQALANHPKVQGIWHEKTLDNDALLIGSASTHNLLEDMIRPLHERFAHRARIFVLYVFGDTPVLQHQHDIALLHKHALSTIATWRGGEADQYSAIQNHALQVLPTSGTYVQENPHFMDALKMLTSKKRKGDICVLIGLEDQEIKEIFSLVS